MNKKVWIFSAVVLVVAIIGGLSFVLPERYVERGIQELEASAGTVFDVSVSNPSPQQFDLHLEAMSAGFPLALNIKNTLKKSVWQSTMTHEVFLDPSFFDAQPANATDWWRENFTDAPVMTGETTFDLLGNYTTHFESFSVAEKFPEVEVDISELIGDVSGNATGNLEYKIDWAGLSVVDTLTNEGELKVLPVSFTGKGKFLAGTIFVGEQELLGEGFEFNQENEWENILISLSSFRVWSHGVEESDRISGETQVSVDRFVVETDEEPLTISDVKLGVKIGGLEPGNIERLNAEMRSMSATGIPGPEAMAELNQLLRNGFTFELNEWQASVNDLAFNLDADIALTENTIADVQNPMSAMGLLGNFSANLDLVFDAGIAEIPQMYDALFTLMMTGALVSDEEQYTMSFSMNNGLPMLNGEPLSIPGF